MNQIDTAHSESIRHSGNECPSHRLVLEAQLGMIQLFIELYRHNLYDIGVKPTISSVEEAESFIRLCKSGYIDAALVYIGEKLRADRLLTRSEQFLWNSERLASSLEKRCMLN